MKLKYTLLCDGSSDRMLIPIINWLIRKNIKVFNIQAVYADLSVIRKQPRTLSERIMASLETYPSDILFVHRDAEKGTYDVRKNEIEDAWTRTTTTTEELGQLRIAVIPIRMSEAWLLINPDAIKAAAGNPNGKAKLGLPKTSQLEKLPNPKKFLYSIIEKASELKGKRLSKLNTPQAVHLVAEYTEDFSPLRQLPAFQKLEADIKNVLTNYRPA